MIIYTKSNIYKQLPITWLFTCIVFFATLVIFTEGVGNWIISGIVASIAALPIGFICILGANALLKLKVQNKLLLIISSTIVGLLFGILGFFIVSFIGFSSKGIVPVFLISGAFAGLLLSIKIIR